MNNTQSLARGFSLMEVAVALLIVGILSALLVPLASSLMESQRGVQTASELQAIYTGIVGNPQQGTYGYLGDVGDYPASLTDLLTSANTGWSGPYISNPRTDVSGVLLDPFGGAVEYSQVTSSGVADYLALVSKGPDRSSTNPMQTSNARSAFTALTYPWLAGYNAGVNRDNILVPDIIDSPGQVRYQSLGTLSYSLSNFDNNAKVNALVPGCPALYQMTVTSVPRGVSDQFTLMYNPGGTSIDLIQGLYTVNIKSVATNNTVFNEQVAVQPAGSNTRTTTLPAIDSSNTATFTLTVNNQSGGGVDIYDYTNTKVGATLASAGSGGYAVKACSPVFMKTDAAGVGTTILDSLTMPYKAYTRRVDNPNALVDLIVTDTGVGNVNTMLKLYENGANLSQGLVIGTVSFKGNKKVKRFFNVKVNDSIMFENQAGTLFGGQTYTVVAGSPNSKTIP
jgi:prepilin-type N-terminal cleavage/methylation domain-containing protein